MINATIAGINGDVAIDNIAVQQGRCEMTLEESIECDFEDKESCKKNLDIKVKGFRVSNGEKPSKGRAKFCSLKVGRL